MFLKLQRNFTGRALFRDFLGISAGILAVVAFSACAGSSPRYIEPLPTETAPPSTQIYFYPNNGQGIEQQNRDRYECYLWAVRETGFDPSVPHLAPHQKVEVLPQPPSGHDTAVSAVTGAVLGAIVGAPHHKAAGAAIGAVAGAVVGSISDAERQAQAKRLQDRYNRQEYEQTARIERQARNYRRAMAACLEGRGYTVSATW